MVVFVYLTVGLKAGDEMGNFKGLTNKIVKLAKALIVSYVATGILLLVLALVFYKFEISNTQIYVGVVVIYVIANLLGGFIIGKITKEKRLIWGLTLGISYFIVLSIISFISTLSFYGSGVNALIALAACVVGGIIGGVLS